MADPTREERARTATCEWLHCDGEEHDATKGDHARMERFLLAFADEVAREEREACAKVADGGRFLHDDAPDARFGKACAAAIRARSPKRSPK